MNKEQVKHVHIFIVILIFWAIYVNLQYLMIVHPMFRVRITCTLD